MNIGIIVLTISEDVVRSKFLRTYNNLTRAFNEDIKCKTFLFTQGFSLEGELADSILVVREDRFLGKPISIVRDYFTDLVLKNNLDLEYILFTDDDFYFRKLSSEVLIRHIEYMEKHKDVGLINFKYKPSGDLEEYSFYKEMNPSNVYMRSGILVRRSSLNSFDNWKSSSECIYYEECLLAMNIYLNGYKIVSSFSPFCHMTLSKGLGKSLERENHIEYDEDFKGGRQILYKEGLILPRKEEEGRLNFKKKPELSDLAKRIHSGE